MQVVEVPFTAAFSTPSAAWLSPLELADAGSLRRDFLGTSRCSRRGLILPAEPLAAVKTLITPLLS